MTPRDQHSQKPLEIEGQSTPGASGAGSDTPARLREWNERSDRMLLVNFSEVLHHKGYQEVAGHESTSHFPAFTAEEISTAVNNERVPGDDAASQILATAAGLTSSHLLSSNVYSQQIIPYTDSAVSASALITRLNRTDDIEETLYAVLSLPVRTAPFSEQQLSCLSMTQDMPILRLSDLAAVSEELLQAWQVEIDNSLVIGYVHQQTRYQHPMPRPSEDVALSNDVATYVEFDYLPLPEKQPTDEEYEAMRAVAIAALSAAGSTGPVGALSATGLLRETEDDNNAVAGESIAPDEDQAPLLEPVTTPIDLWAPHWAALGLVPLGNTTIADLPIRADSCDTESLTPAAEDPVLQLLDDALTRVVTSTEESFLSVFGESGAAPNESAQNGSSAGTVDASWEDQFKAAAVDPHELRIQVTSGRPAISPDLIELFNLADRDTTPPGYPWPDSSYTPADIRDIYHLNAKLGIEDLSVAVYEGPRMVAFASAQKYDTSTEGVVDFALLSYHDAPLPGVANLGLSVTRALIRAISEVWPDVTTLRVEIPSYSAKWQHLLGLEPTSVALTTYWQQLTSQ